jgi:hypothetical protein
MRLFSVLLPKVQLPNVLLPNVLLPNVPLPVFYGLSFSTRQLPQMYKT